MGMKEFIFSLAKEIQIYFATAILLLATVLCVIIPGLNGLLKNKVENNRMPKLNMVCDCMPFLAKPRICICF